jgi:ribosomal protein S7
MSKKIDSNEIYTSIILNKFLNCFQKKGKKNFVENMFYKILLKMKKKQINGLLVFFYCIEIIKPLMILLPSRKSGIIHFVGSMLSFQEQYFFGLR